MFPPKIFGNTKVFFETDAILFLHLPTAMKRKTSTKGRMEACRTFAQDGLSKEYMKFSSFIWTDL
jgi:hypothetical protein